MNPRPATRRLRRLPSRPWLELQRTAARGRVDVALVAGGVLAFVLAAALPLVARPAGWAIYSLFAGSGAVMLCISHVVGFRPAALASVLAAATVMLVDSGWGSSHALDPFYMSDSAVTLAVLSVATILGAALRGMHTTAE